MARATPWRVTLTLTMLRVTLTLAMVRVTLALLLALLLSVTRALARRGPSVDTARCAPRPPSDGRAPRVRDRARARARARVRVKVTDPISLTLTRSRSAASALLSAYYSSATTCPRDQGMRRVRGEDGSWRWEIWARYARDMGEMWARYRRDGRQLEVGDGAASPLPTRSSLGGPLGGR